MASTLYRLSSRTALVAPSSAGVRLVTPSSPSTSVSFYFDPSSALKGLRLSSAARPLSLERSFKRFSTRADAEVEDFGAVHPTPPTPAARKDLNLEDLDNEQLDDLFETYGEVVKGESEPAPRSSEGDDDAESLAFAVALAEVANDVKAGEIQVLCVKPLVYWTRFFVIATGFSRPQVDAIGKRMRDTAEEHFKRTPRGDLKPNAWTLLDFGDVVVHIFYPKERSFYNLEEFYGNAIRVELPFEPESQMC